MEFVVWCLLLRFGLKVFEVTGYIRSSLDEVSVESVIESVKLSANGHHEDTFAVAEHSDCSVGVVLELYLTTVQTSDFTIEALGESGEYCEVAKFGVVSNTIDHDEHNVNLYKVHIWCI